MSGGYLRVNGSFVKRLPIPKSLPDSLSFVSKVLQFLTQLRYELNQKPDLPPYNNLNLEKIENFINFYENLSNSLVNQLYSDTQEVLVHIDANDLPNFNFKFIKAYYNFPRFEIYSDEEFFQNLKKIGNFYDIYN